MYESNLKQRNRSRTILEMAGVLAISLPLCSVASAATDVTNYSLRGNGVNANFFIPINDCANAVGLVAYSSEARKISSDGIPGPTPIEIITLTYDVYDFCTYEWLGGGYGDTATNISFTGGGLQRAELNAVVNFRDYKSGEVRQVPVDLVFESDGSRYNGHSSTSSSTAFVLEIARSNSTWTYATATGTIDGKSVDTNSTSGTISQYRSGQLSVIRFVK